MRSRALPDNFDMAKALHSPLSGGPIQSGHIQTLPRPYSMPATSLNYNATLGDLSTIREPHRHLGPDSAVEAIPPSPMSGHSDYYHPSPSSGTVSGNQSPSSPDRLSAMSGYSRSSYGYLPHFPHGPGNFSHNMYAQPPRSVGPHDQASGIQPGRGSPLQHNPPYLGDVNNQSSPFQPGIKTSTNLPTSMPTNVACTFHSAILHGVVNPYLFTTLSQDYKYPRSKFKKLTISIDNPAFRPTADPSKNQSGYSSDYDARLNPYSPSQHYGGVAQPQSHPPTLAPPNPQNRMRSHTSPSGHPGGYCSSPPAVFAGPYSAPLAHPPAAGTGAPSASSVGVTYNQRYRTPTTSPKAEAGQTDSQQQGIGSYYGTSSRSIQPPTGLGLYRANNADDGDSERPRRESDPMPSAYTEHPA